MEKGPGATPGPFSMPVYLRGTRKDLLTAGPRPPEPRPVTVTRKRPLVTANLVLRVRTTRTLDPSLPRFFRTTRYEVASASERYVTRT